MGFFFLFPLRTYIVLLFVVALELGKLLVAMVAAGGLFQSNARSISITPFCFDVSPPLFPGCLGGMEPFSFRSMEEGGAKNINFCTTCLNWRLTCTSDLRSRASSVIPPSGGGASSESRLEYCWACRWWMRLPTMSVPAPMWAATIYKAQCSTAPKATPCSNCGSCVHCANKLAHRHRRILFFGRRPSAALLCDICKEWMAFVFYDCAILCLDSHNPIYSANKLNAKNTCFLFVGVRARHAVHARAPCPAQDHFSSAPQRAKESQLL